MDKRLWYMDLEQRSGADAAVRTAAAVARQPGSPGYRQPRGGNHTTGPSTNLSASLGAPQNPFDALPSPGQLLYNLR